MIEKFDLDDYIEKMSELAEAKLEFGNSYLDCAAGGIMNNDLIILAAGTSSGKTEQAMSIALHNAINGKVVYIFGLEGFKYELEARVVFRTATEAYYKNEYKSIFFNFQHYLNRDIPKEIKKYVDGAEDQLKALSKNFRTIYRERDYTIKDFENHLLEINMDTDLIIIDHLHFLDYHERNEYEALSNIMKKLRDLVQLSNIPVIMVSQINPNKLKTHSKIIAGESDLHGSSNIAKVASKIITIAPDFSRETGKASSFPTLLRVAKNRYNGSVNRFVASMDFNIKDNTYSEKYYLSKLNFTETSLDDIETDYPTWSKKHIVKGGNIGSF